MRIGCKRFICSRSAHVDTQTLLMASAHVLLRQFRRVHTEGSTAPQIDQRPQEHLQCIFAREHLCATIASLSETIDAWRLVRAVKEFPDATELFVWTDVLVVARS